MVEVVVPTVNTIFFVVVVLNSFVSFLSVIFLLLGLFLLIENFILEFYVVHSFLVVLVTQHTHQLPCAGEYFALKFFFLAAQVHFRKL